MRLLLDTHIVLWAVLGSPRLQPDVRRLIEAADEVLVSAASVWEVAIKVRLGKLAVDVPELLAAITESGFVHLPVTAHHAAGVAALPPHHQDPFDRLLVAQAISEPLHLITADAALAPYSALVKVV